MSVNDNIPAPDSPSRRRARLRLIGIFVLLLGIGSAGIVYWMGTRSDDLSDDPSMIGYNRAASRQMGVLYGNMGLMINDLFDDLKRPGTQATIIVVVATLVMFGCFYFARLPDNPDEPR
jgi:hypothetical protein